MTSYAVGDIQGCFDPLQELLERVKFNPKKDQIWFAGDLVNRGPKSLETLEFVKSLGDSAKVVLGNHDLHLLAVYFGHRNPHPKDTLTQILKAKHCEQLIHWLLQQPLIQHCDNLGYTMTHAGIPAIWSTRKALKLAEEVSKVLQSNKRNQFFAAMYGNEPDTWDDDLEGMDRLRVITNYFTRMRFTNAKGKLDLKNKRGPECAPAKMKPWFEFEPEKQRSTHLLFGHWAALEGKTDKNSVTALDTGAVWGGKLTLMNLSNRKLYQVNA